MYESRDGLITPADAAMIAWNNIMPLISKRGEVLA